MNGVLKGRKTDLDKKYIELNRSANFRAMHENMKNPKKGANYGCFNIISNNILNNIINK